MSVEQRGTSREEIRGAILDAVGRMLLKYGYRKMTVEDIAREAGIGKGTVYLHFRSKEEVALGWFDRAHCSTHDDLNAIAQSDLAPDQKLQELLVRRVTAGFDAAQEFAESLDELFAAVRPSLLARRQRYQANMAGIVADVLREGCARGTFGVADVDSVALSIVLAITSLLPYSLSVAQLGRRDEIEDRARVISGLLLNGLRSHGS